MSEILSLFVFIFFSALPGRTTFLLLMLAANGSATRIFIGASLAFLVQSLISVLIGQALGVIPQAYVEITAGLLFLWFSRKFWLESKDSFIAANTDQIQSVASVFTLIFVAEFGDVSQLAIAASASRESSRILVFFTAVGTLWLITALAIFFGRSFGRILRRALLQKIASFGFFITGLYLCVFGAARLF